LRVLAVLLAPVELSDATRGGRNRTGAPGWQSEGCARLCGSC